MARVVITAVVLEGQPSATTVSIEFYLPGRCSRADLAREPLLDHWEGTPLPGRSTGFKHCSGLLPDRFGTL
jgi:hypothetical protein